MNGNDKQKLTVTPEFLAGRGYSLSKAARAVDVRVTHLIKVCKGERKPSDALLERIYALPAYHPVKCKVNW
ncbi:MAG: helix-turn-helix transcriptional regulator [Akkermansia sp.]|nr:helix-turn-helix transcriptional regulator [Akkermansia sp.]